MAVRARNSCTYKADASRIPVTPRARALACVSGAQLGCKPASVLQASGNRVHHTPQLHTVVCRASAIPQSPEKPQERLKRMRVLEGAADDPQLANPLQRMHRLGTGWFGVIFEYEGVLVEDAHENHMKAWLELFEHEGRAIPPQWALKRAEGMKNEQVISEVLCLSRNPVEVRRLAQEKEAIFQRLQADRKPVAMPGVVKLLQTLRTHDIPTAVASTEPEPRLLDGLSRAGLTPYVDAIISGSDVSRGRPDPEPYLYAAQDIRRPPLRCVVVGNSNLSVEAAHEVGMQCVTVATRHPVYELTAADLVVRQLEQLSVQNLKQLFRLEEGVEPPQPELEAEADTGAQTRVGLLERDDFRDDIYLN